tara:strand:- start:1746 stop:2339 length:594 start_codon:yes stop_codon:yes gene_type:complete
MNPLKSIPMTVALGFILSLVIILILSGENLQLNLWALSTWLHVFFGIIWIGLLYYFNFVQVPGVATAIADKDGPGPAAINKYIAPKALFYFRWGALLTWLTGASTLHYADGMSIHGAFALQGGNEVIGIGAWLGTIMLLNVWGLIWPNQKKVLGIKKATESEIAKAKVIALMASRTNTLLSIPMLMCMVGFGHGLPM